MDKMYRDTGAAEGMKAAVPTKEDRGKKKDNKDTGKESGKRTSSACAAPVDDSPEYSNSKRSKVAAPQVKKVPAGLAGIDGTFTVSTTLDDK